MTDWLLEKIKPLVGHMRDLARQAHAGYAAEVDALIAVRSRDTQRIERLLEGILDFYLDDAMNETLTIDDLQFEVRRSTRRKTLGLTVDRFGELVVHAPELTDTGALCARIETLPFKN